MPHSHGLSAVAVIFRRYAAPIGCASREIVLDSFSNKGETAMRIFVIKMSILFALLLAATACARITASDQTGPVVNTAEGPVTGLARNGVYEFRGIPYAAPPVGNLRWMPPQPVGKWKEPRDATHFGNICAQVTTLGVFAGPASVNEDCLYLNVFTTKLGKGNTPQSGLAVIVWIHGGGNVEGTAADY